MIHAASIELEWTAPCRHGLTRELSSAIWQELPLAVHGPVAGESLRAGVDVVDAFLGLRDGDWIAGLIGHPGVIAERHGVLRNALQVAALDQIVQGAWAFFLIDGVAVDGRAHGVQVFLEDGFLSLAYGLQVARNGNCREQADDGHDDHQLDDGEAGLTGSCSPGAGQRIVRSRHHVLYFVPSREVPLLLL